MSTDIPKKIEVRTPQDLAKILSEQDKKFAKDLLVEFVKVPEYRPAIYAEIGFWELMRNWVWYNLINKTRNAMEGQDTMGDLKPFLTNFVVRWVLKVAGGWFLAVGVSSDDVTAIVSGLVAVLIGVVTSLFNSKKLLNTEPPKPAQ